MANALASWEANTLIGSDPFKIGFACAGPPWTMQGTAVWTSANRSAFMRNMGAGFVSNANFRVVTQSGNIAIAVYANTGTGKMAAPGTLIGTTGSIACPAAAQDVTVPLGFSVNMSHGDFWWGFACDNGVAAFGCPFASGAVLSAQNGWCAIQDIFPLPAVVVPVYEWARMPFIAGS